MRGGRPRRRPSSPWQGAHMADRAPDFLVQKWLINIALMTAGTIDQVLELRIAKYVDHLAPKFPPEVFTPASEEFIGRDLKFFPAYSELNDLLWKWWERHRPRERFVAIARPPGPIPLPPPMKPAHRSSSAPWHRA